MRNFVMSIILVSSLMMMAGCDNGTTGNEGLVVAEQYRGTFVQENNTSRYLTITENRLIASFSDDDVGSLVYTESSRLYFSESTNLIGTFTDNDTFVWNDPSLPTKFIRKPE